MGERGAVDEKACSASGKLLNIALTRSESQTTQTELADFSTAGPYRTTTTTGGGEGHSDSRGTSNNCSSKKAAKAAVQLFKQLSK